MIRGVSFREVTNHAIVLASERHEVLQRRRAEDVKPASIVQ